MLLKRLFLLGVGWFFVAVAIVGIFLPLLPTTPFLLLSSACFVRSSPRAAQWLHQRSIFAPMIQNWHKHRAIDRKSKRLANGVIVISFIISIILVPTLWQKIMLAVMAVVLLLLLNRLKELEQVAHHQENT